MLCFKVGRIGGKVHFCYNQFSSIGTYTLKWSRSKSRNFERGRPLSQEMTSEKRQDLSFFQKTLIYIAMGLKVVSSTELTGTG